MSLLAGALGALKMNACAKLFGIVLVAFGLPACAEVAVQELSPYPLPADVEQSLAMLAGECDVLILGETHGTKEAPAVVEALLAPLTKLGYRSLALEVPHDEQPAIEAWATGSSSAVPAFFAIPGADGRGNEQVLALVRRALRPPFEWKLICFDETEAEMLRQVMERMPKDGKSTIAERAAKLSPDDLVAISVARDAAMAEQLAAGKSAFDTGVKILAICGNFHARTADHSPADSPLKPLWPSMAATLVRDHAEWRIRSLNVEPFGGEYFNGGKVNRFGKRPLDRVSFRLTPDADWDAVLQLPTATAATFLAPQAAPN
jgi:hypothetical protein